MTNEERVCIGSMAEALFFSNKVQDYIAKTTAPRQDQEYLADDFGGKTTDGGQDSLVGGDNASTSNVFPSLSFNDSGGLGEFLQQMR